MLPPPLLSRLVLSFLLVCSCHGGSAPTPQSDPHQLRVLLDLKAALGITAATSGFDSWRADNHPCNFSGVQCAAGSVSAIDLANMNLSGNFPFASVCRLPTLAKLWLGSNNLYGNVTADIGECTNLEFLDMATNSFSGLIPDLSSLQKLQVLNLSDNAFTGQFPWASLKSMPGLVALALGDNPFKATRAFPEEVLGLTGLGSLYLSNCSIYGRIPPSIGNLTELFNLELSDNLLHGEIPPEISKLRGLQQLELYDNKLTGRLPAGLGNLFSLNFFDASGNMLEGNLSEIRHLTKLISLQLFENNFSGEVPQEVGEFRDLVNLSLYSNRLSGRLPQTLGSWAEFDFIDVSTNLFTGPIPPDMCKKGAMTKLLVITNDYSDGQSDAQRSLTRTTRRKEREEGSITQDNNTRIYVVRRDSVSSYIHGRRRQRNFTRCGEITKKSTPQPGGTNPHCKTLSNSHPPRPARSFSKMPLGLSPWDDETRRRGSPFIVRKRPSVPLPLWRETGLL